MGGVYKINILTFFIRNIIWSRFLLDLSLLGPLGPPKGTRNELRKLGKRILSPFWRPILSPTLEPRTIPKTPARLHCGRQTFLQTPSRLYFEAQSIVLSSLIRFTNPLKEKGQRNCVSTLNRVADFFKKWRVCCIRSKIIMLRLPKSILLSRIRNRVSVSSKENLSIRSRILYRVGNFLE